MTRFSLEYLQRSAAYNSLYSRKIMEYIHHAATELLATEDIILPPKIPPVSETECFSTAIKPISEPIVHSKQYSPSHEESKEDESIEDFVRSLFRDRIHGTLLMLQQRDRRCSKLANVAGGSWKSWTELWVERCGDVCPDAKETQYSADYQGAHVDTPHPTPSAKTASEPPDRMGKKTFWRRVLCLFTCCTNSDVTQEPVDSLSLNDATEKYDFNELPKRDSFGPFPGFRRSASTVW
ncbi:hypothetical protein J437_LFUL018916 [Ladona fulva]|uniref:Uncharacterized protein n=1 Tax=Ladona fulva TaxID=123851 RepID=A0A8K0KPT1_LADFU|nr:hypothetical protein J437_LFUL018916 [Ladona fulva]